VKSSEAIGATAPAGETDWGATAFVWSIWTLMLGAAVFLVMECGSNVPFGEDWLMVPVVTGEQPLSPALFWEPYAEHRMPLGRLIYVYLLKLGGSYRKGMLFNVLILAALAATMILAMRAFRGRTTYTDAFIPLALLHWGHHQNFLWWWEIVFVLPVAFVGFLLVLVVRSSHEWTTRRTVLVGICLVLLPLGGPISLAFVPAMACWLVYVGLLQWRLGKAPNLRNAALAWAFAATAVLLIPLYFFGLEKPEHHPESPGFLAIFGTATEFLANGLGPAIIPIGNYKRLNYVGLALIVLVGLNALLLIWAWYQGRGNRVLTVGLLCFTGGVGCLAFGLALARSGFGEGQGFARHYVTVAALLLYGLYFTWGACYPSTLGRLVQMCLFLLVCGLLVENSKIGYQDSMNQKMRMTSLERDLQAGVPALVLSQRYTDDFAPANDPDDLDGVYASLVDQMYMLQRAGIGAFRFLRDPPSTEIREVPIPIEPVNVDQMVWENGTGRATGSSPTLVFALKEPQFVCGVRLTCSYEETASPALLKLYWKNAAEHEFGEERSTTRQIKTRSEDQTVTLWVYDRLDHFLIAPDNKECVFKISDIAMLTPASDSSPVPGP
jgi:hypothetical protein